MRGRETRSSQRHGGSGTDQIPNKPRNDFTTFFFSNFPNGFGEMDMRKVFQRWARVKEVFISRRLNKWGRRFGFVRFFDVGNVGRLEKELDQIFIGSKKLHVNVPRYRRFELQASRTTRRGEKNPNLVSQGGPWRRSLEGPVVRGRVVTKETWVEKKGKKSYAEIVKEGPQQKWKGPVITTQKQTLPWMECSAIGQFNAELDFEQLGDEFLKGGMSMIKIRYLGDKLALLTPREGENLESLIKLNKEWFESVFDSIDPWSENHVAGHKIVWVRCYGVPITLWNKDCFSKVVGEMASLVSIDKATLLWENLEYARLQVRLLKNRNARLAKKMKINDQILSIFVKEETPCETKGLCKCRYDGFASSDSIASSETFVEETACSVNSCEEEIR
ncbi:uncharacterized protein [Phaseolus vulgaris]|uniref:uncharacterized protein n=1 Tax=Phaseolus vulgaris TaxID=3885 RepID=UPI0035CC96F4